MVDTGDKGTPRIVEGKDGVLDNSSELRRKCAGVAPMYVSRALIGEEGCGNAEERVKDPTPPDVLLCIYKRLFMPNRSLLTLHTRTMK